MPDSSPSTSPLGPAARMATPHRVSIRTRTNRFTPGTAAAREWTEMNKFKVGDRLKAKWLPRLTTDCLGAFCLSEAASGSDAFALRATATRDGGDFVLEGEQMCISNPNPHPNPHPHLSP